MNRFHFRLDRVLHLRTRIEREQAQALGRALHAEQQRRDDLDQAAASLDRADRQARGAGGQTTHAGTLRNLALAVRAAAQRLEQAVDSHRDARVAVDEEQTRLAAARVERRVLERLREKREAEHRLETSRREQRDLDGLGRRQPRPGGEA